MSDTAFGKYCLIAELGHGGMADVLLAVAVGPAGVNFTKLVVIKRLRTNLADDPEFMTMLLDEARLAARLNHPNLVQTYEVGQVGDQYFIAMEYLDGQALNRVTYRARRLGGLPSEMHYRILADTLSGLHSAHELADFDGTPFHVVHRDVTPHNVFVTYDGQVKVVDFGIAKAVGRSAETRTGTLKGKLTYMAPEQALAKKVDRRADIFSVGVMLWEAATGTRYWKGFEDVQIMQRLVSGELPPPPREINPNVAEAIDKICRRATAYVPEHRYDTAADFQNDLEAYLDEVALSKTSSPGSEAQTVRRVGNRELGKFVSSMFSDKRAELKNIIERQLALLRQTSSNFQLISIGSEGSGNAMGGTPSHSGTAPMPVTGGFSVPPLGSLPPGAAPPGASQPPSRTESLTPHHGTARTLVSGGTRGRRVQRWILAVGAMSLVGVSAFALLRSSRGQPRTPEQPAATDEPQPVTAVTPGGPTSAPAPASSGNEHYVIVTLKASPPDAKLSIDDGPLLENPYVRRVVPDDAKHVIRGTAPGHVSKTMVVKFDKDLEVELRLDRASGAVAPGARPPQEATAPAKPPSGRKRAIDQDFPLE